MDHSRLLGGLIAFHLYKNIDAGLYIARGYVDGLGELSQDEKWRNALQVGVYLLHWRQAGWVSADKDGMELKQRVWAIGKNIVLNSWKKEKEWFSGDEGRVFAFLL